MKNKIKIKCERCGHIREVGEKYSRKKYSKREFCSNCQPIKTAIGNWSLRCLKCGGRFQVTDNQYQEGKRNDICDSCIKPPHLPNRHVKACKFCGLPVVWKDFHEHCEKRASRIKNGGIINETWWARILGDALDTEMIKARERLKNQVTIWNKEEGIEALKQKFPDVYERLYS